MVSLSKIKVKKSAYRLKIWIWQDIKNPYWRLIFPPSNALTQTKAIRIRYLENKVSQACDIKLIPLSTSQLSDIINNFHYVYTSRQARYVNLRQTFGSFRDESLTPNNFCEPLTHNINPTPMIDYGNFSGSCLLSKIACKIISSFSMV